MNMEEAKAMMSNTSLDKLKDVVCARKSINMTNKTNNDILMQALCRAVSDGVIRESSLDDKIIKLLNSPTNTLSQNKLFDILTRIRQHQDILCVISLTNSDMSDTLKTWVFDGSDNMGNFGSMLKYVISKFNITPIVIRNKMTNTLKPTIVNNISQFISKYINENPKDENVRVSIITITRLVNMSDHLLLAEFRER